MSILNQNDFGIFNQLIQACQNCPIDLKLGVVISFTVRQNVEKEKGQKQDQEGLEPVAGGKKIMIDTYIDN